MNCTCLRETADKLKEKLVSKEDLRDLRPANAESLDSVNAQNMAIMFSSGKWILQIPFKTVWNTRTKKGITGMRDKTVYVTASHCPFCGKEFVE